MTDFDLALAFVLEQEGGTSDHPADRGGLTHYGISRAAFGKRYPDFFEAPSIEKATTIYRRHFWHKPADGHGMAEPDLCASRLPRDLRDRKCWDSL